MYKNDLLDIGIFCLYNKRRVRFFGVEEMSIRLIYRFIGGFDMNKKIVVLILTIFMAAGLIFPAGVKNVEAANPSLQAWYYRKNENQADYTLEGIAINGSTGVAVGDEGVILLSKDKTISDRITPFSKENFSGVVYAKSKYFVVSQSGNVYSSSIGITWSKIFYAGNALNGILYGNNTLVAYGKNGGAYSTNGTNWYKFTTPISSISYCGTFANSRFMIGGDSGKIFISVDGKTWVQTNDPANTSDIYGLTYGNNTYLAAGLNQFIATSKDGRTWEKQIAPLQDADFTGAIFCKDHFVLLSLFDATGMEDKVPKKKVNFYFISKDGKAWTTRGFYLDYTYVKSPWINNWIYSSDGYIYGVGDNGVIEKSKDGLRWAFVNSTTAAFFNDIIKNGTTYVAVGNEDSVDGAIFISKDGYRWGQVVNPEIPVDEKDLYLFPMKKMLYTVAYGKGTYVIGGADGILMYSKNSVDWAVIKNSPVVDSIMQIEFVKDRFIGVTSNGSIIASYDGITWGEGAVQQKDFDITGMAYDEKGNIIVEGAQWRGSPAGWTGTIIYRFNSSELNPIGGSKATWNNPQSISDDSVKWMGNVCYGNGTFVIIGYNGHVFTSKDAGITWTMNSAPDLYGGMIDVDYGHGHFVAVGANQSIATSPDGIKWTMTTIAENRGMYSEDYCTIILTPDFSYITTSDKRMLYASNGYENWMDIESDLNYNINDVVFTSKFGFVGAADNGYLFISKDGSTWFKMQIPNCSDTLTNIYYVQASGTLIASTAYGTIYGTKDLTNWTSYNVPGGASIDASASNGKTVTVIVGEGANTAVLTSDINCKIWTYSKVNFGGTICGLTYSNNYYVAVGTNGTIRYSKDGKTWTKATVATTETFTSVAKCGDRFIAVGTNGVIAYSYNGYSKWTVLKTSFKDNLLDICSSGNIALITSTNGKIYMSQNKTSWTLIKPISFGTFYAGAVNSFNVFVIVGENGLIMQSLPISYI
jgi:photosystem II stability/assembly factor-like uncharacterized protein